MSTQLAVLLLEAPTIRMNFTGTDPTSGQHLAGVNLGPVDTNLSKPTQSLLAAVIQRDLPDLGFDPRFGMFDGKTLPLQFVGVGLSKLVNAGYAQPRRVISYADGSIETYRLGKGLEAIVDRLSDFPILGATANFTFESDLILEAVAEYKRANPRGKVIVGGRDATFRTEHYLEAGVDAVVRGEGEKIAARLIVDLVEDRKDVIPGVVYCRDGNTIGLGPTILRAPVKELPLPHFFNPAEILRADLPGGQLKYYVESQDGPLLPGVSPPVFHFFTSRGCVFGCPFCTTAGMRYDAMAIEQVDAMLKHLRQSGVRTLISAEDAFLERVVALGRARGREEVMAIIAMIRGYGFAIEWANGINFNMLYDQTAKELDLELLDAVFSNEVVNGHRVGTYRMLTPVERPSGDARLKKLASVPTQHQIVAEIVRRHRTPSQGVTWILRPEDTPEQITVMKRSVQALRDEIKAASGGESTSRLGLFCLMPHPGCLDSKLERLAAFSIDEYPELRHYFLSVLNGQELGGMGYAEQFWTRLKVLQELDPESFATWMAQGGYKR